MIRVAAALLALMLMSSESDARRYRIYKVAKPKPVAAVAAPATAQVRIIPLTRWIVWCERVGGLECP